jgi:hypothetical protein
MTKDMKFDGGKALAAIPFQDFPLAIQELVKVCTFGAQKYDRSSWQDVANAEVRYEDALARHFLAQYIEDVDPESGLYHKAHLAWNALATLEMALREEVPYTVDDECYNDCCTTSDPEFSDEIDMDVIMTTFGPYAFVRK